MNKSTCDLLFRFIDSSGIKISMDRLADELAISERSIYNYIQEINDFLHAIELTPIQSFPNKELSFVCTPKDIIKICNVFLKESFYLYRLSVEERIPLISMIFLSTNHYITLSQLSKKLFVSRSTLVKDMKNVTNYFAKNSIYFNPKKDKGYRLQINEVDRRTHLLKLLRPLRRDMSSTINCFHDLYATMVFNILSFSEHFTTIKSLVHDTEVQFNYNFTDQEFWNLCITLIIIINRLQAGEYIRVLPVIYQEVSVKTPFFSALIDKLSWAFPLIKNDEEQLFLASQVYKIIPNSHRPKNSLADVELNIAIKYFLYNVYSEFPFNFAGDLRLQNFLFNHIKNSTKPFHQNAKNENVFKTELKAEYPQFYASIKQNVWILEGAVNYTFDEDDISFILMHIVAAAQRFHQHCPALRVIVACNTSICTSNFLAEKLRRIFRIDIIRTTSTHLLQEVIEREHCDIVVSTVPLELKDTPWVKVSPILTEENMLTLYREFSQIMNSKRGALEVTQFTPEYQSLFNNCQKILYTYVDNDQIGSAFNSLEQVFKEFSYIDNFGMFSHTFSSFLSPKNIVLDVTVKDWKEAIAYAGAIMERQGLIQATCTNSLNDSVADKGPHLVFSPGLAIAKVTPLDGALQFGLVLIRINNPINFGNQRNDPVQFVLGLSLLDDPQCVDPVFSAMMTLSNANCLQLLTKAEDNHQIIQIIKTFENQIASA